MTRRFVVHGILLDSHAHDMQSGSPERTHRAIDHDRLLPTQVAICEKTGRLEATGSRSDGEASG